MTLDSCIDSTIYLLSTFCKTYPSFLVSYWIPTKPIAKISYYLVWAHYTNELKQMSIQGLQMVGHQWGNLTLLNDTGSHTNYFSIQIHASKYHHQIWRTFYSQIPFCSTFHKSPLNCVECLLFTCISATSWFVYFVHSNWKFVVTKLSRSIFTL